MGTKSFGTATIASIWFFVQERRENKIGRKETSKEKKIVNKRIIRKKDHQVKKALVRKRTTFTLYSLIEYNFYLLDGLHRIVVTHHRYAATPSLLAGRYGDCHVVDVTSDSDNPQWVKFSPYYPHSEIPVPFSPGCFSECVEGIWQGTFTKVIINIF